MEHVWRSEDNLGESVISSHCVYHEDQTQMIRSGGKRLYLWAILLVLKASALGCLFRGTVCIRQIVCVCCWDHTQDRPHTKHIFFYWATRSALCIHIFAQVHTFLQIFFLTSLYILDLSQISQYMKKSGTSAVLYPSVIKLSQAHWF